MKALDLIIKIIGAAAFVAITYFKVTGGNVDVTWLAIPAVIMASNSELVDKIISVVIKK